MNFRKKEIFWCVTTGINTDNTKRNSTDTETAMASRNTDLAPRVWRQIYLHWQALIGVIPRVLGFDVWWSRVHVK